MKCEFSKQKNVILSELLKRRKRVLPKVCNEKIKGYD